MDEKLLRAMREAAQNPSLREMSPRIKNHYETLTERMNHRQVMWGGDRTVLTPETERQSTVIRRAMAFCDVMENMPAAVEPWDLIAGNCMKDGVITRCVLPVFLRDDELGKCTLNISHKCPDYETLLSKGLSGILEELDRREALLSEGEENAGKREFAQAVRMEAQAVVSLAHRYRDLARQAGNESLASVLDTVPEFPARTFREAIQSIWLVNHVFTETMSYLSIGRIDHLLYPYFERDYLAGTITLEQAQELVDQFCLKVNDRAQLLPENYVVDQKQLPGAPRQCRLDYNFGFVDKADTDEADAINHWGQNILVSGLNPDGSDDTNVLSYLFLNAHEKLKMTDPTLTVRLHRGSPELLRMRVAEVLKTGGGMPYINNDDILVPAYEKLGVSREDACDYANSNCWETLLQGRCNQEMIRGVNFLSLLELVLFRGKSLVYAADQQKSSADNPSDPQTLSPWVGPSNPVVDGIDTGPVELITDMNALMTAWTAQLDNMLAVSMKLVANELREHGSHGPLSSNALLSALTRDCVEKLTDICHRGARYDLWHILAEAVANAADAVGAIEKFVFEEHLLTLPELAEILRNNWEGAELLRQRFLNEAPKFGNGNSRVDVIAEEMIDRFLERVSWYASLYPEIVFCPCVATFSWIVNIGRRIGASADGRFSREAIAANLSPAPSRDISGPTAALHSYFCLNTSTMAAGAPIDLRVSLNGLEGEEGTRRIEAMIRTFLESGGNMMTLTITSVEELRRAMACPQQYRSLRVRMGGWSAYYTLLSRESQKIHLKRVEHGLA